ncbi:MULTISPECIES: preprotein translocase subunit SecE [Microbacterium]|uniref:Protein translocase subunit SecE n=1 Tax=Microbacterium resistens TaxID=156977 RepID=A0ABY3RW34_9MICO|nr:preprotein translocase subunit SecE [Microbacterium resistens]MBW1638583.1 preprotein translocase subunit SecE [Microbacterium resistens]MDA4891988.1 preprotein translocase subunit SecE [Streptomyces sp. MS2A]UGS28292.1 preprotein translocase subunit SecE [Microbacterium resistens]
MVQDASGAVVSAANGGAGREKKLGFFGRIALFFRQVIAELRKVVTPTRKELVKYTLVVLAFVLVMMGLVYGLDMVFSWLTAQVFGVPA